MTNQELAMQVAQRFNKDVLKNQLNPNGASVQTLTKMIEDALDETCNDVWEAARSEFDEKL